MAHPLVVEESGTYPLEVLALAMMMVIGINLLHLVVGVGEMDSMHLNNNELQLIPGLSI